MKLKKLTDLNKFLALSCVAVFLTACGGGGGGSAPSGFTPIAGGDTQATSSVAASCVDCAVASVDAAADGNFSSAAVLRMPATSSGIVAVRVTAQDGVVYPMGSDITFRWGRASGGSSTSVTLITYLDGVQTATYVADGASNRERQPANNDAFSALAMFDAVEFSVNKQAGTSDSELTIFGFAVR